MRTDRLLVVVIVLIAAASAIIFASKVTRSDDVEVVESPPAEPRSLSTLVVGVQGLDLSIVRRLSDEGRLPNMAKLIDEGTLAEFEAMDGSVDPRIVWTSLVTGVSPENQGLGGTKVGARGDTVKASLVSSSRTVGTLWTALSDRGAPVGVVGWWGTWPAEELNGVVVVPYNTYYLERKHDGIPERQVYPLELLDVVDPLIADPDVFERKDLLRFVDTDAGLGPEALIGKGYSDLALAYASDSSTLDVAAALTAAPGVEAEFVLLPGVETVSQTFWHMAHPDQIAWDTLTEMTTEVLTGQIPALGGIIDRYYEYVDEILGELMALVEEGGTVAVVSDHGYGRLRYGKDGQPLLGGNLYDDTGFWIISGPRVREGKRVERCDLLDFAPTLAAAVGIELGSGVEGAVCSEALRE